MAGHLSDISTCLWSGPGNILHLIGNIYQAEGHVERGPECRNILRHYAKDEHCITFSPAPGHGAGIDFIGKFRD